MIYYVIFRDDSHSYGITKLGIPLPEELLPWGGRQPCLQNRYGIAEYASILNIQCVGWENWGCLANAFCFEEWNEGGG